MSSLFQQLRDVFQQLLDRFTSWATEMDSRNRSGEFGKYPWQQDYGLWPWQRRRKP